MTTLRVLGKINECQAEAYLGKMGSTKIKIGPSSWHLQCKGLKESFSLEAGIKLVAEEYTAWDDSHSRRENINSVSERDWINEERVNPTGIIKFYAPLPPSCWKLEV